MLDSHIPFHKHQTPKITVGRLKLPLSALYSRCLSDPVPVHAGSGGDPVVSDRAGHWPEDAARLAGGVEHHPPLAGRHRHRLLHRHLLRCLVLQRHHYLGFLLLFQLVSG